MVLGDLIDRSLWGSGFRGLECFAQKMPPFKSTGSGLTLGKTTFWQYRGFSCIKELKLSFYMGGCQNYGPFLDAYCNAAPN